MRIPALLLSLAFAHAAPALAAPPAKEPGDVLTFKAVERTLPNGLRVLVVPTGFPDLVSVQIPMQTGSRNEVEPGKSGFAHFFEHMMFRGTKAYPPDAYQAIVTRIGARQNAYTSDDVTNYHMTFAKQDLEKVLEIEADRFMNLDYSVAAFKTESRAILGEYNKNASNPLQKLEEVQRDSAFRVHPYKHTTMGFLADIEDMPNQYAYSKTFYARWYRPEHATVVIAGDVDPQKVLPLVEKYFGRWQRGSHRVEIPAEPAAHGPVYANVPWTTPTLPWVAVAFHGPAFSDVKKDWPAVDLLFDLHFGETSDLYKQLVVEEQKVDALFADSGANVDPGLVTVYARLKSPADAIHVRDAILRTFARARSEAPAAARLAEQKAHQRSAFLRGLDSTEAIAGKIARYAMYARSYGTLNRLFRTYAALTPDDLLATARRYFTDERLVVTTLAKDPLPAGIERTPALAAVGGAPAQAGAAGAAAGEVPVVAVPSKLPIVTVKLLFEAGSARDPRGKEGLAGLAAAMLADAGSRRMRIDEIRDALHPLAASFEAQVDKELVTLTGTFPKDGWERFADVALPQLTDPGFREEDFRRVKDDRMNALVQDLRETNDEELGKERLQANVFAGTPYGHPALGTVEGLRAVTLDDVKAFVRAHYTRANLVAGLGGDAPAPLRARVQAELAKLPAGEKLAPTTIAARRPKGIEVEIVEKDTPGVAISFGHPLDVVRGQPDFVALWLAKTWLGEHRSSSSHLYQRIREERGMNYGDYAYVEAFPRGMFQFFPAPNVARRAQLFEVWIRPVVPANAQMAIRIALHELGRLVDQGLTEEEFEATREYLMKNVFVMTARQDQQVGYALDSRWYGTPEFTRYMREGLAKLHRDDVNAAIKRHLSAKDLSFVIVAKDAKALAEALVADGVSTVKYDAEKSPALLEEDRAIGATRLGIRREAVRVTPASEVFAR
ncbi:M16 family metallopeptidase [Anaeromyxobacter terrae]|uniref:M16 family metallopeptidase n=1 Tax=Anaeromyxobacter terrae TaxID=2925406 RepID=UPI001F591CE0|nr:M16 family metallopeptidase [Anaeromyxobacter sp. SG22]